MNRNEFNAALRRKLDGIAETDRKSILDYYNECIDDRMDDGASEEEAIAALGSLDELAAAVLADAPVTGLIPRVTPEESRSRRVSRKDAQVIEPGFRGLDVELANCDLRMALSEDRECRVAYDGSARFGLPEVAVRGDRLVIRNDPMSVKWRERITGWLEDSGERRVTVFLPAGDYDILRVHLDSGDCNLEAGLRFGTADLRSRSGDVTCAAEFRDTLHIETTSGDVDLRSLVCEGELTIQSSSGDVNAAAVRCGRLRANTASGDLEIRELGCDRAEIRTVSGDLQVENAAVSGDLRVQTVSGDLSLDCRKAGSISLVTVSGDIEARFAQRMQFAVSTVSGEVRVPASDSSGVPCSVRSVSGDILVRS